MITAVDSNILIDVFGNDKNFGHSSAAALKDCIREGALLSCGIVWAETAMAFSNQKQFLAAMETLHIGFASLDEQAILLAAKKFQKYRANGGKRKRILADFLIGAHAQRNADRLLTRDRGFYRKYFSELKILDPKGAFKN